jgi:preprotein translocase subunit SecA
MAGRGTDIKLGEGVTGFGGLFVLGTERHEARRIDNQLRGRSGRQGDPGATQFFVSLDDDVMRIFGGERIKSLMRRLRVPESEPIENRLVSKALEGAQERVEGHYFDMRKQVLSYDDVLNRQRNAIYTLRRSLLLERRWREPGVEVISLHVRAMALLGEHVEAIVTSHTQGRAMADWNIEEISEDLHALTGVAIAATHEKLSSVLRAHRGDDDAAIENLQKTAKGLAEIRFHEKEKELGSETFARLLAAGSLRAIDIHWMDHLDTMDYLRTGIGLRGYGQRDPLVEYQREGHRLFQQLLATIKTAWLEVIFKAQAVSQERMRGVASHESVTTPHSIANAVSHEAGITRNLRAASGPDSNPYKNAGRNDPCPCGSGKKFKKCHGK